MKIEQLSINKEEKMINHVDDFYKNRRLSERIDNLKSFSHFDVMCKRFLEMNPEKSLNVSTEEEIITKVVKKHEEKDAINPIHFFNYKGVEIKIGEFKSLNKLLYSIKIEKQSRDGYFSGEIEENIKKIIQEAEEMIRETEEQK